MSKFEKQKQPCCICKGHKAKRMKRGSRHVGANGEHYILSSRQNWKRSVAESVQLNENFSMTLYCRMEKRSESYVATD